MSVCHSVCGHPCVRHSVGTGQAVVCWLHATPALSTTPTALCACKGWCPALQVIQEEGEALVCGHTERWVPRPVHDAAASGSDWAQLNLRAGIGVGRATGSVVTMGRRAGESCGGRGLCWLTRPEDCEPPARPGAGAKQSDAAGWGLGGGWEGTPFHLTVT